ncbi:hypothetical protein [Leadbettera azotonutricia]|uniref:Uncharacterized protein n=1 Tax=Leadbettera azotonutricia (strain ATCC BAA-888 / DSM 13862 / ZAS-9) TaxID=545695 RepID=F5Y9W2_LEAAZ|nr:hypothetical protein [Leadbettera azotonutricia]AEF83270.1 hypothetical protein TREAZ_3157 [Leadbettera azotonutricia ZAS-9]
MRLRFSGFLTALLLAGLPAFLPAQIAGEDPVSFIGLTLRELTGRFGAPQSVYAVRGIEEWQDDVVFVYSDGDFYVFKDRVWQVGIKAAFRIRAGDPKAAALLALGEGVEDRGDHLLYPIAGRSWPLTLRCNFDSSGKTTAIFIYRSDL